ncbi:MAG: hypothetical protein ACREL5_05000 [Gemmatimonadales bacterium]
MSHRTTRHRALLAALTIPMATLYVAACGGNKPTPPPPPGQPVAEGPPECPIDTVTLRLGRDSVRKVTMLQVSGPKTTVPEFNDCQRFATTDEKAYGPLVGIFAADSLNDIILHIRQLAAANDSNRALAIAVIVSFDSAYTPLGIKPDINCLYLAAEPGNKNIGDSAFVLPVTSDADCVTPRSIKALMTDSTVTYLPVAPRDLGSKYKAANRDYPEVARWDWDRRAKQQYIGIGCREQWCEIGKLKQESPKYDDAGMIPHHRRKLQIKGWYDEEVLAVNDATGKGLVPGPVVGTIVPAPGLEDLTMADYDTGFTTAARVYLNNDLPAYQKKFGFLKTKSPGNRHLFNAIAMCHVGTSNKCDIPDGMAPKNCDISGGEWYARVQPVGTAPARYLCVTRRTHQLPELLKRIAGVVRWRWKISDQNAWIACPAGCCEVVGEK